MTTALLLEHEVMALLRCSKSTVKRLRKSKKVLGSTGRPVRYDAVSVEAYAKSLFCQPTLVDAATKSDADVAALARRDALKRRLAKGR